MIELAWHKRRRFGTRTEGLDQLKLSLEDTEADEAIIDHINEVISTAREQSSAEMAKGIPKRMALAGQLSLDM